MKIAYTVEEAAGLCSLSENNLRELIRQGKIVARQCGSGRALRIGHAALEQFFTTPEDATNCSNPASATANPGEPQRPIRGGKR